MTHQIIHGDCIDVMRGMPDNSVDAIVTDPPYGLTSARPGGRSAATEGRVMRGFMGLEWDGDVPSVEVWAEALRVLKPGGYLLSFAGTRTQHRMACRIEDAGFEIRDMIAWVYGSGFPKSHNGEWGGTALKPALEPITMARKPLVGTVAANVLAYGTGGLNIDECRVPHSEELRHGAGGTWDAMHRHEGRQGEPSADRRHNERGGTDFALKPGPRGGDIAGRWPANLIHDGSDEVMEAFPNAPGQLAHASLNADARKKQNVYGAMRRGRGTEPSANSANEGVVGFKMRPGDRRLDSGSAARFFYCAKASKTERGEGNNHPTVKPLALMRYLVRLVTPQGGKVLDPYAGSGTTLLACIAEGFDCIAIERDLDSVAIINARVARTELRGEQQTATDCDQLALSLSDNDALEAA